MDTTYLDRFKEFKELNPGKELEIRFNPVNRDKFKHEVFSGVVLIEDDTYENDGFLMGPKGATAPL